MTSQNGQNMKEQHEAAAPVYQGQRLSFSRLLARICFLWSLVFASYMMLNIATEAEIKFAIPCSIQLDRIDPPDCFSSM